MKKLKVRLPRHPHEIWVGHGILSRKSPSLKSRAQELAVVIADIRLKKHSKTLVNYLKKAGWRTEVLFVEATEAFKDFGSIYPLYGKLLKMEADRKSVIFALGGGVIGD